ncbi:5-methyltetrahydropteroyltriglutamate--homocysteine S-methyltransferase [Taibaiella helva]|uniref:5-methyltetrahydropteroyltriglutamate-- homocysteine S-methyltransferase n=1 Tax=Taibaiella helva TaxID=2301235 RepID=UPI000E5701A4|nr:5-methyltetrahydropteroyltriglutamate--homocysteine S-methyltransferase [Taibaiella helva]
MLLNNLGYPRIGARRELKKACEQYWAGEINRDQLYDTARELSRRHWQIQADSGIDLVPCNDFSFYDHVLDMSLTLGVIPERYTPVLTNVKGNTELDLCFAMARGYQKDGFDITAMEMTKWFDTNYHYIVPEFQAEQTFQLFSQRVFEAFNGARETLGRVPKPVLIGPVSFLLLGKEKGAGFDRIDLLPRLLPVYISLLSRLADYGADWVQLDEPMLGLDLREQDKKAFVSAYQAIKRACPQIRILLTTYFEGLEENMPLALSLPVCALHLDLVRAPQQLEAALAAIPEERILSLGLIDGRNIWKNDYEQSLQLLQTALEHIGADRIMIAPSCSLLHSPVDLSLETRLPEEIKDWMAFAQQKLQELKALKDIVNGDTALLEARCQSIARRRASPLIHKEAVQQKTAAITDADARRQQAFPGRQVLQQQAFGLPLFPTTTIGSFPQTAAIRQWRQQWKKGQLSTAQYEALLQEETERTVRLQEDIGLDVLVHGEFERNDMVEYFGEQLEGFTFTQNGWVQSYGSRCVKPPVIYGDINRPGDMTVAWSRYAQSLTDKPMKGMLTGPVTILQWSFVRDDQPREATANQIALAIREEVLALETAGIRMIQIDEPAIREGLPLRRHKQDHYLQWAVKAFRIAAGGVQDSTQIHTHMCYSEFNDIIAHIAAMDADVITIETSRSQMELLEAFATFRYPNEIGPGVYDIHSPRVPSIAEMSELLQKAAALLPAKNLWVNPDCGLKTRNWPETETALRHMVAAATKAREMVPTA